MKNIWNNDVKEFLEQMRLRQEKANEVPEEDINNQTKRYDNLLRQLAMRH